MPDFITINKIDAQGAILKYDVYLTEQEAIDRVTELVDLGFTDAFYVDGAQTAVDGQTCAQNTKHWTADAVAKTVNLDTASVTAENLLINMVALRSARNAKLADSDNRVLADQWAAMNATAQSDWASYRQALRDIPATTPDPANPSWPVEPS